MNNKRRNFIKKTLLATSGIAFSSGLSAKSYRKTIRSNDRIRVWIVGFSNRIKYSLIPSILQF